MHYRPALAYECPTCHFDLWVPVAHLSVSTLGFYNDSRFPGRCILALDEHYEHFTELPDSLTTAYALDIKRAGAGVARATEAARINYEILGNTVPHLHCHVIPRSKRPRDPNPERPIWESPLPRGRLSEDDVKVITDRIRAFLNSPVN